MPLSSLSASIFPHSLYNHKFIIFFNLVKCNIWCSVPELSSENLRTCFQIVNAYIYLSATEFLQVRYALTHTHTHSKIHIHYIELLLFYIDFFSQNYAESLCRSFCDLLKDITNEGQVQVLKVLSLSVILLILCLFSHSLFFHPPTLSLFCVCLCGPVN